MQPLPKGVVSYIEHELHNYQTTKAEIEEFQDDIIFGGRPVFGDVATQGKHRISRPTESKALRLVTTAYHQRAIKVVAAIDWALQVNGFADLFKVYYLEGKSWQTASMDLNMSQSTFFHHRRKLIEAVALQLGLINPS